MAVVLGILLLLASVYFGIEGVTITVRAESAMHQIYAAVTLLTCIVSAAGGGILCSIGYANSTRNQARADVVALKAEISGLRADLVRKPETGSAATKPDIEVRPGYAGPVPPHLRDR